MCVLLGALIASRQPRNPEGWTLLSLALCLIALIDAGLYAVLDYHLHHGRLPLGEPAVFLKDTLGEMLIFVLALQVLRDLALVALISRTVSYALLPGCLCVYIAMITLATRVLPVRGPVAVTASTLVAAALFNPLRRRVQHSVGRRFNGPRYDAEATVAAFAERLQGAVELEATRQEMLKAIRATLEPGLTMSACPSAAEGRVQRARHPCAATRPPGTCRR